MNNPYFYSTLSGTPTTQITDSTDHPHTGLIKALSQAARGNYTVKTATDFNITFASAGGFTTIAVTAGKAYRDGKLHTVDALSATSMNTSYNSGTGAVDITPVADDVYLMLVALDGGGSNDTMVLRGVNTSTNAVPALVDGDVPIALIKVVGGSADDATSTSTRMVQYFTTSKKENTLSVGYDNSGYTETANITGASGGTTITSSGILTLDADDTKLTASANAKPTLSLENTTAISSAATPPAIEFKRSGTPAQSGDLGMVTFVGKDSDNDTDHEYVRIFADMQDETEGTEDGRLIFNIGRGSNQSNSVTNTEMLRLSGGEGIIFNYQKNNVDFEIRGDTNDNVFIADAGTESVGIGATPITNARLTVEGVLALDEVSAPTNTADYGQLYANADNDLHYMDGAGTDTPLLKGGKHTIWVPASAMYANTTAGCSALTQVELSNGPELKVLDFDDGSDEYAQFTVAFPKSWNEGTVTFQPFWTISATGTNTVAWQLAGVGFGNSDDINTAFGTAVATTALAHSGTSGDMMVSAESNAVTISGASADSVTYFQINRNTSTDNHASDARLIGIKIFYDIDAGNDE